MGLRDLYSNTTTRNAINAASFAATAMGVSVDLFGCRSAELVLSVGAIVGAADFSATLQDSPDGTTWTTVAAPYLQSDAPATLLANSTYRLGYLGGKRYIRARLPLASGTSATIAAIAVLEPLQRPVA